MMSRDKGWPTSLVTNQATELLASTRQNLAPKKHCLTNQLKNNVHKGQVFFIQSSAMALRTWFQHNYGS